ncbi:alginate O-acetyltransferase AlgF [Deinococcus oregonensis]|uniref:Alginate biosynthesis protein AlgF n=1 Tax=Deinococcus oregonensis TaxID=1805970 RepID=A0ABV6B0C0_9DEIO
MRPILFALFLTGVISAQQDLPYDPEPPPNAAFVRVINATAAPLKLNMNGEMLAIPAKRASAYRVIAKTSLPVQVGTQTLNFPLKAKTFYSVAVVNQGAALKTVLLTDGQSFPRTKAALSIYNLSDAKTVSLKTADGNTTVFQRIAPLQMKSLLVNGIAVQLTAFADGKPIQTLQNVQFQIGFAYSVLVMGQRGHYTASFVPSTTTRSTP